MAAGRRAGVRYVRTNRGFALFDDEGRFVGRVETGTDVTFGPTGDNILLKRQM